MGVILPRALVVGKTMALYETVLLDAIFPFAVEVAEMLKYQQTFLIERAAVE